MLAAPTVMFGAIKAGLTRDEGPRLCGRIVFVDIGLTLNPHDAVGEATVVEKRAG